ncbi:MerR family transcriptional regulator [Pseudoclavibacter endophyticus]|uniref:MerR family transcriptional regulator n=1 Tax=Pseudoclavibacter endophyticus TaxID=1778590 RepID=A0A6H9WL64_9MICO|nr:MerR family transcriptional regulator [Pseudoclavibacter endophyticus]KAB1648252.1 MerR family transcriptional regulator [Pseudoclavibacter endophyticus]GGA71063.1 MerR family transcriptional regulator [Pseudoclavibacter endophyticus]
MAYSIAEVAETTGLTAHTLRYYERDDLLLTPVARDTGGRRVYDDGDLRWIVMLTRLRATGMPISSIRQYAELVRAGDGNEAERLALLTAHRKVVLGRLAEVTEHLGAIEGKIAIYAERVSVTA